MMNLNIQLFGGRGASSSNAKQEQQAVSKIMQESSYYDNGRLDDYGDWWQDNVDNLADRFEEKYNKPPVDNYGETNSKWDPFTRSEHKKELRERNKKLVDYYKNLKKMHEQRLKNAPKDADVTRDTIKSAIKYADEQIKKYGGK